LRGLQCSEVQQEMHSRVRQWLVVPLDDLGQLSLVRVQGGGRRLQGDQMQQACTAVSVDSGLVA
jgi:hypothetical protein